MKDLGFVAGVVSGGLFLFVIVALVIGVWAVRSAGAADAKELELDYGLDPRTVELGEEIEGNRFRGNKVVMLPPSGSMTAAGIFPDMRS